MAWGVFLIKHQNIHKFVTQWHSHFAIYSIDFIVIELYFLTVRIDDPVMYVLYSTVLYVSSKFEWHTNNFDSFVS